MKNFLVCVLGALCLFAAPNLAQAATYTINFSLSSSGPQSPITGSFSYTAAAPEGPIQSLTDINLTIDGHAYTLPEVSFLDPAGAGVFANFAQIFASDSPVDPGTNDFFLLYNPETLALFASGGPGFVYASANHEGFFSATGVLSRSEVAPVPLPAAVVLFGSGLGLMGLLVRRRRRSKASA